MKISHPLYHEPTDIKAVLNGVASQENCDGSDYDLMVTAADYIQDLELTIKELRQELRDYEK